MKKFIHNYFPFFLFSIGFAMILYPSVAQLYNEDKQTKAISIYQKTTTEIDYAGAREDAEEYNNKLLRVPYPFVNYNFVEGYEDQLNLEPNGMMGWIEIDKINVRLAIYHGTSDSILNSAVGHLEGSSLPVGGESTHAVLMAHRGLPNATLFSDLDRVQVGDTFTVKVLQESLYYEVDEIKEVEPDEYECLYVQEGKDLVTLVTCTPYGINTERLLVTGHRIPGPVPEYNNVSKDWIIVIIVGTLIGSFILYFIFILIRKLFAHRIKTV